MTEIRLFVNPKAGRGSALKALPRIEAALNATGVTVDTRLSDDAGDIAVGVKARIGEHIETQVNEAVRGGDGHIVVAGGDGSFHEAVNGMLQAGGEQIGLLPIGTGNDFAKSAGIPADVEVAARELGQRIADGQSLGRFDAGRCNERFFHNGAGIGIDAKVARIAASIRLPIGDLVYAWGIVRCLIDGIATPSMTIVADDETAWEGPATLANVANGRWVGSRFLIAPEAVANDGRFDLVVADAVTRRRVISLLPLLLDGRHIDAPEVVTRRVRSLRVACDAPIIAQLDGEVQPAADTFVIDCLPSALHLL